MQREMQHKQNIFFVVLNIVYFSIGKYYIDVARLMKGIDYNRYKTESHNRIKELRGVSSIV